jgi:hypothetical protein
MLRTTPRIDVDQRSREARLRLERAERLIVAVMTRRSLLVARTNGLAAKLRRVLSRSGLVLTALTDDIEQPVGDITRKSGIDADQMNMDLR